VTGRGTQELVELGVGPGLGFGPSDRLQPGGAGEESDVAGEQTATDGVGEATPDDEVDLIDGLGCQGGSLDARREELVVERLDMVGSEPAQTDASERRQDVALRVTFVTPVGAGGELQLLGGQPLAGEVGADGQRPHGVGRACPAAS
jgi:hypothetical protein